MQDVLTRLLGIAIIAFGIFTLRSLRLDHQTGQIRLKHGRVADREKNPGEYGYYFGVRVIMAIVMTLLGVAVTAGIIR